jgi:MFS transporter, PAT family, beta-lactamase induction signal transducer AmpG
MLIYGMAAGLPNALLLGTLYAWLGEVGVDLETMGVFSLIGLAYAFKFLWSPLVDRGRVPGLWRLGRRSSWLVPIQALVGLVLIVLSQLNPQTSIGLFSLLAGIAAFASATQDIVIDAWRVEVADDRAPLELLSSVYQLGYRLATLAGGALALVLAARVGWQAVYAGFGVFMLVVMLASWFAPDTRWDEPLDGEADTQAHPLARRVRMAALALVGLLWGWAGITVIVFMVARWVRNLPTGPMPRPSSGFTGPLIVIATVVVPAIVAAVLDGWRRCGRHLASDVDAAALPGFFDHAYRALVEPLAELVGRLRWAAILVLAIVLSYRLTDSIWGPFAFPFYLQELQYTNDEVAFASKFFGVGMTMAGIALGAVLFAVIGRMPTVLLGAAVAAASNLLYADLAQGGAGLDLFSRVSGFTGWRPSLARTSAWPGSAGDRGREPVGRAGRRGLRRLPLLDHRQEPCRRAICAAVLADRAGRLARPGGAGRMDRPGGLCAGVLVHRRAGADRGGADGAGLGAAGAQRTDQAGHSRLSRRTSPAR